jgi:hypothetical protein
MERFKKIFVISVMLVTVLSMSVVTVPQAKAAASAGDLIKMAGLSSVYYLAADGKRYVFPNEQTYFSWYSDFSGVVTIPQAELESYPLGANVTIRPGTKLVKITTNPKVYAVTSGGNLVAIPDETTASTLYGSNWNKRIVDVPDAFFTNYKTSTATVSATAYPQGSLVKFPGASDVYLINADGTASKVASEAVLTANRFRMADVITATITKPTTGADISGAVATLTDTSSGAGGTPAVNAGTGLTVALASDNPAAASILADSTNPAVLDAQGLIPVLKLNFTAAPDGDVKVTTLKLTRGGISADSDVDNAYLYDGDSIVARLADMQSISTKVMTFTDSAGLFTVTKGTSKAILVRFDLNRAATSGKTVSFSLNAATDVVTNGASVSGSFPLTGNVMSTATTADFGNLNVSRVNDNSSAVDPGSTGFTAAHYTLTPSNQEMKVYYLKFQMIGSASVTDVTNIKLYDSATQVGTTQQLNASKIVTFDLTATPITMSSSQVKTLYIKVDVPSGSTRTFYFSLQKKADIITKDTAYGIYVAPNNGTVGTFTSQDSGQVTIGSGSLTVSKATDSPTSNIADAATSLTLAKYSMKAVGEDIKVSSIGYYATVSSSRTLKNSKILVDGTQVGTTNTTLTGGGATNVVTTTVNFTVPAGVTKYLTIVADTTGTTEVNDTVTITLNGGGTNGQRASALTTLPVPSSGVNANTLTVKSGTVTTAKNTGLGDYSSASPTGVVGKTGVKIGSFTVKAGSGEDVNVTKITLSDNATDALGDEYQNLLIKRQDTGAQVGSTIGTLQTSTSYSYEFSPATTLTITNGQTMIFDVYADILSNASKTATAYQALRVLNVAATGFSTSADASDATDVNLQNVYLAASGSLTIENVASSDQVPAQIVYASGTTNNVVDVYKFKLTALTESIDISRVIVSDTISISSGSATTANGKPTTTLYNFELWNGATKVAGPVSLYSTSTPVNGGYLDFNMGTVTPLNVVPGTPVTLTVKATVNQAAALSSGSTHTFSLNATPIQDSSTTRAITAQGHDSSASKNGPSTGVSGNAITVRVSYPILTKLAASPNLPSGSGSALTIAKFKVKAGGDDISLKKITFDVTINDTTTTTALSFSAFKLYRNGSLVASTEYDIFDGLGTVATNQLSNSGTGSMSVVTLKSASAGAQYSTSTRMILVFDNVTNLAAGGTAAGEEVISGGSENTYEIKADYTNAHQGATTDSDSIVVQLLGEASSVSAPSTGDLSVLAGASYRHGAIGIGGTSYNFIWSDYSSNTGDHTVTLPSTGADWTMGYQVRGADTTNQVFLPLDSWTLGK